VTGPLVVVGDLLLDIDVHGRAGRLAPDAPVPVLDVEDETLRPGGAGLAAVLAARRSEREVVLLTPLARDERAERLVALLAEHGVTTVGLPHDGRTPVKRRLLAQDDRPLLRLDEGGGHPSGPLPLAGRRALRSAAAVLVADYGQGASGVGAVREALGAVAAPVVWDPHPRGAAPVPDATLVTPNEHEADVLSGGMAAVARQAAALRAEWAAQGVVVTLGHRGALLDVGGPPLVVPTPDGDVGRAADTCGAGDCFSGAAALALASGATTLEAVGDGVAAAASFVRSGGVHATDPAAAPPVTLVGMDAARAVATRIGHAGGTVVATGGCFDLLHAGHIATLRAARALGDCLIVLVNSDASVRRLKGASRPVVPEADRMHVLAALDCVDAVAVFDDDTPVPALRTLRPDVWAKGGDYAGAPLPEAAELADWGGVAVVLPYLEGRSTTHLVRRVAAAAG
jgi:rfaE bifunctional protein nucleotidyltransferase chain/domain